jgi:hypothetical protein
VEVSLTDAGLKRYGCRLKNVRSPKTGWARQSWTSSNVDLALPGSLGTISEILF